MQNNKKEFIAPPECPVFEPSWDEFRDPLAYIAKIRSIGEQYGLIKIRTPPSWQPPFAIDVETFKFTPRIQKLNELEALSRVKLNFLDQLTKFWKLQGITLKIPMIDGKTIDLYTLQKIVSREGGFEAVNNKGKQQTTKTTPSKNQNKTSPTKASTNAWCRVAQMMGYSMGRGCETMVSHTYETIIHPYDLFISGVTLTNKKKLNKGDIKKEFPVRKMKKMRRMASNLPCYQAVEEKPKNSSTSNKNSSHGSKTSSFMTKADQYFCEVCEGGDDESLMLLCEGCDMAYHTYCLVPPLHKVPPGDWLCPSCISKEICRPMEAYGFEQSQNEYTLEMFGQKADSFKENHFKMAPQKVGYSQCEKEFWRLVACLEEDVSVEYGADIHSGEQGSGFPTERSRHLFSGDDANNIEEYIRSGWNLNNLPLLEPSVLKHISVDISGMKVPWVYVGMCFSSFSWHIEDHWSYSVNYMHWGEPKTWYGVAGRDAERLEECMMKEVPELFKHQPDLLHQLTTIINPNILMHYGVPVFRTDQCPGEFVITFPRSYHAGFNQGYNFAEAVNFCPPDWLPLGRECVEQYRKFKRRCVFSHDQLLCEIAEVPDKVNIEVTKAVLNDLLHVAAKEAALRSAAKAAGCMEERFMFNEVENDDDRECHVCKTTCFLSAIYCPLDSGRLICLDHDQSEYGCKCATANHTIRYRYTLQELSQLVDNLRNRSLSLDNWKAKVTTALQTTEDKKNDISYLKDLHQGHSAQNLPADPLHHHLTAVIHASEQLIEAARLLVNKKVNCRLSMEELETFCAKVKALPCTFKEASLIKDLHDNVLVFQNEVSTMLDSSKVTSSWRLQEVVDWGASLNVDFPELSKLQLLLVQSKWLDEYNDLFNNTNNKKLTINLLRKLCENLLINNNHSDNRHLHVVYCNAANKVKELLMCSEAVELKAQNCLKEGPTIQSLELVIREASVLENVDLHHTEKAKSLLHRAKIWQNLASLQINRGHGLHLDELEELMEEGSNIMVRLDALNVLQNRYKMAVSWKQKVFECFLDPSKNSILQPWFSKLGIRLNFPTRKRESTVLSSDGSFHCPYTAITLDSLQLVVKETVDKLVVMRNSSTKKLLEHGKSKGTNGLCVCGHNFTNHVKCCVLCTIVYMADCSIFERQHDHQLPQQQQNQTNNNLSLTSFNSNKPIGPFSLTNQSMFSTPPSFPLNSVMQGPFHNNQSSSIFGTANSILGPVISSNKNGPGVNLFSPSNQRFPMSNAPFSPSNTGSGMFQWTNSTSQGPFASTYKSPPSHNNNMTQFSSPGEGGLNVCESCRHKVHRPRYSELKSLVAGWYSMNGACLPEGRALLYLLDLVNEWQMKAREVLSSRELVVAIGLLDLPLNDQCTQETSEMAPPIPPQVTQLSVDPILRPRLFSLEVSVSLQTLMADLLVESMALNVETMECVQLRSLIYACYEKIVISESLKKEEEKKKKMVEDEMRRKEEERMKRMMEEKNKRENEELKRRSLEEMEFKMRLKEEDKRKDAGKITNDNDDDIKQSNAYTLSMFNKNMHGDKFIYDDDEEEDDDDDDDDISDCDDQISKTDNNRNNKRNDHVKNEEKENGRSKTKKNGIKNKKKNKKAVKKDIYSDDEDDDKEEDDDSDKDDDYSSVEYKKTKDTKKNKNTKKSKLENYKKLKNDKRSRKNKNQVGRKKKKKRKRSDDDDNDNDNDDDDIYDVVHYTDDDGDRSDDEEVAGNKWDICSMPDCLKPTRAKVDWVQCDKCEEWYHLDCVNLSRLPEEQEDYHCPMCVKEVKNSNSKDSKNKKGKKQKKEYTSNTPENEGISRKNKNNKMNKKNNEDHMSTQRRSTEISSDKNHLDSNKRSQTKKSPQKNKTNKNNSQKKSRASNEKLKKNKSVNNDDDDDDYDDHTKKKKKYSPSSSSSSSSSLQTKRVSEITRSYKEEDEDEEEDEEEEEEDDDDDDDDDYKDYEKITKNKSVKSRKKTLKCTEYARSDSHSSSNSVSCALLKSPLVNNNTNNNNNNNNNTKSFDSYLYAPWLDKR